MPPEEVEIGAQSLKELIATQQPQSPQDAQEANSFTRHRRQEGNDRRDIQPGERMEQISQPMPADEKPGAEVGEEDQPEHDIERFDEPVTRRERGRDDKHQCHQIQHKKSATEAMRIWPVAFVEGSQLVLETFDAAETCGELLMSHAFIRGIPEALADRVILAT